MSPFLLYTVLPCQIMGDKSQLVDKAEQSHSVKNIELFDMTIFSKMSLVKPND